MTGLRITLQLAGIKVLVWSVLAERALCRGIRRAVDWLVPAG